MKKINFLYKMEKTIHKFLDHLLGDEVIAVMVKSLPVLKIFHIVSKKKSNTDF